MKKIILDAAHMDERGIIKDVFYNTNIHHVGYITSYKGAMRGNHYHRETTQWIFMTKGSLVYIHAMVVDGLGRHSPDTVGWTHLYTGQMIETPPYEAHALYFPEDADFVVFSVGKRGGKDYESDTFRLQDKYKILTPETVKENENLWKV